jgi:hypothetical protein
VLREHVADLVLGGGEGEVADVHFHSMLDSIARVVRNRARTRARSGVGCRGTPPDTRGAVKT